MADDITITPGSGAVVSAADTTTLNGGAVTTKVQRVRVGYGTAATHRDVDTGFPFPVSLTSTTITGSVAVTGTFFQATQPVSIATMPSTPVTGTFWQATQPVSFTQPALVAGAAVIGAVTQSGTWNVGSITTLPALVAGAALIGKVGIDQTTPGTTNAVVNTPATPTASIISSAATTNATSIKASAGTLYSITVSNVGAAAAFVKLYNLAAAPTVGTSVPALTIPVAASGSVTIPFGSQGIRFGTGIALAITNLVADSDVTAIAAAQVKVLTSYI